MQITNHLDVFGFMNEAENKIDCDSITLILNKIIISFLVQFGCKFISFPFIFS